MSILEPSAAAEPVPASPSSSYKWPTPFVNLTNASAYPPWAPVDTAKKTTQIFRFSFYTTVGAYAWLYLWKRATFKLGLPLSVVGFATVATAAKGMISNLRQKNDGWNTLGAVGLGNLVILTAGFKSMPVKHKLMSGIGGACLAAFVEHALYAQSPSTPGSDIRFSAEGDGVKKQGFWDVYKRRPMLETVQELGVGRGIIDK